MYTFYWYPKCSTCRKAKSVLDAQAVSYQAIDLKQTPPSATQFEKWFKKFPVKKFFNTSGLVYRELGLKDKLTDLSEKEAAELLASNGMLIKRPLMVKDDEIVMIGFKEEQYKNEL
ncbi:Spx/MgsR family RNA polymerase-binding regulatory protein [Lactococcus nasutitermitis]|uniref:Spx/MgsR family RNA polymerase-binding regulatory protein n=1 Tax=Lactococcus nasutitermitis TaxID=1652957 RepID=A0ABV9JBV8_9LACT|nr:Spx/MgsR family RNA polymerase-binding regulatory protein [Lactococcus nasutitermitis]